MYSVWVWRCIRACVYSTKCNTPTQHRQKNSPHVQLPSPSSGLPPAHFLSLWNRLFAVQVDSLLGFRFSTAWLSRRDGDVPFHMHFKGNVRWYSRGRILTLCLSFEGRVTSVDQTSHFSLTWSHSATLGSGTRRILERLADGEMCDPLWGFLGLNRMPVFNSSQRDVLLLPWIPGEKHSEAPHFLLSQAGVFQWQSGTMRR